MPAHNACRPRHTPCSAPYPSPWRGADIRAVGTHGDAAPQVLDHLLTEAGVGAGATRLGAIEACLYALDECIGVHGCGAWMGVEHLPCVGHGHNSFLKLSLMPVYNLVDNNRRSLGRV